MNEHISVVKRHINSKWPLGHSQLSAAVNVLWKNFTAEEATLQ